MTDEQISEDVALAEFERFAEMMALDFDESRLDDDDKAGLKKQRSIFLRAVQDGRLRVSDAGEPIVTLSTGEELTFEEPTGATVAQMDRAKKDHNVAKLYLIMGAQTGTNSVKFSQMANRDLKICQMVTTLFLT